MPKYIDSNRGAVISRNDLLDNSDAAIQRLVDSLPNDITYIALVSERTIEPAERPLFDAMIKLLNKLQDKDPPLRIKTIALAIDPFIYNEQILLIRNLPDDLEELQLHFVRYEMLEPQQLLTLFRELKPSIRKLGIPSSGYIGLNKLSTPTLTEAFTILASTLTNLREIHFTNQFLFFFQNERQLRSTIELISILTPLIEKVELIDLSYNTAAFSHIRACDTNYLVQLFTALKTAAENRQTLRFSGLTDYILTSENRVLRSVDDVIRLLNILPPCADDKITFPAFDDDYTLDEKRRIFQNLPPSVKLVAFNRAYDERGKISSRRPKIHEWYAEIYNDLDNNIRVSRRNLVRKEEHEKTVYEKAPSVVDFFGAKELPATLFIGFLDADEILTLEFTIKFYTIVDKFIKKHFIDKIKTLTKAEVAELRARIDEYRNNIDMPSIEEADKDIILSRYDITNEQFDEWYATLLETFPTQDREYVSSLLTQIVIPFDEFGTFDIIRFYDKYRLGKLLEIRAAATEARAEHTTYPHRHPHKRSRTPSPGPLTDDSSTHKRARHSKQAD